MFVNTYHSRSTSGAHPQLISRSFPTSSINSWKWKAEGMQHNPVPYPRLIAANNILNPNITTSNVKGRIRSSPPHLKLIPNPFDHLKYQTHSTNTRTKANNRELRSPLCPPTRVIASPRAKTVTFRVHGTKGEAGKDGMELDDDVALFGKRRNALGDTKEIARLFARRTALKKLSSSFGRSFSLSAAPIIRIPHRRHSLSISLATKRTVKQTAAPSGKFSLPSISLLLKDLETDYARGLRANYERELERKRKERLF